MIDTDIHTEHHAWCNHPGNFHHIMDIKPYMVGTSVPHIGTDVFRFI